MEFPGLESRDGMMEWKAIEVTLVYNRATVSSYSQ